ncbi:MAG: DUF4340 domain-containing protein [Gammaproteobacteria bacterium]|nr:DUF4340 domain-containing protein [Gammaproteobacteria bacterium]
MIKKLNSLTILLIITVVMVILMLITIQGPSDNNDDYSLLFPDLFEQLSDVDTLKFKSSQDEFTLFKKDEDWYIKERWNHPADFNLVKRALIDIAESKILDRKTANPEQYPILGVEGADNGGSSLLVTLLSGDKEMASLIIGNEREVGQTAGPRQFYVRRDGEERTWFVEGYLNLNRFMINWIKSEVVNIARERIAQVNIIQPNGDTATLVNTGAKDKFGTPTALDKTVFKYDQLGYDIAGTLFQLRMEDVQPIAEFSRGDAEIVIAEFITFDGMKVTTETSFIDGQYFTTFNAEFDPALVKTAPEDIQALDVLKSADDVNKEVAKLNKDLQAWAYRFGGFVGTNLMRAKADIVTETSNVIPMPIDMMGVAAP